jgi:hypothetical protein
MRGKKYGYIKWGGERDKDRDILWKNKDALKMRMAHIFL